MELFNRYMNFFKTTGSKAEDFRIDSIISDCNKLY
jgi:hypothetical protein